MNKVFRDVLKAGALFFAVGIVLALVAPPLATMIGPAVLGEATFAHAMTTPVLWTGAFFGAFGAIDAAVRPMFSWVFGDKPENAAANAATAKDAAAAKQVNITVVQSPQQTQGQAVVDVKHQQAIKAERMVALMAGNDKVPNA